MTEYCIKNCEYVLKKDGYYYCTEGEYEICLGVTIGKTLRHDNCKQPKAMPIVRKVKKTITRECARCKHCENGLCYRFPPQPAIKDCGIYGHPSYVTVWKYPEIQDKPCGEYRKV